MWTLKAIPVKQTCWPAFCTKPNSLSLLLYWLLPSIQLYLDHLSFIYNLIETNECKYILRRYQIALRVRWYVFSVFICFDLLNTFFVLTYLFFALLLVEYFPLHVYAFLLCKERQTQKNLSMASQKCLESSLNQLGIPFCLKPCEDKVQSRWYFYLITDRRNMSVSAGCPL